MQSPFITHRDEVMGHYGTAAWLRQLVLAKWNGTDYQIGLSNLAGFDDDRAPAAFDMLLSYRRRGESDPAFMSLARDCLARRNAEIAQTQRAEALAWSIGEAEKTAGHYG